MNQSSERLQKLLGILHELPEIVDCSACAVRCCSEHFIENGPLLVHGDGNSTIDEREKIAKSVQNNLPNFIAEKRDPTKIINYIMGRSMIPLYADVVDGKIVSFCAAYSPKDCKCMIHKYRPEFCREYPLSISRATGEISVDTACPYSREVTNRLDTLGLRYEFCNFSEHNRKELQLSHIL